MVGKAIAGASAVFYATLAVRAAQTYQHWRKEKEMLSHYNTTFFNYIEELHYKKALASFEAAEEKPLQS